MIRLTIVLAMVAASASLATQAAARSCQIIVAPGVEINVLDEGVGSRSAPALVLIPGWRFPATIWSSQIARFSPERRVIAVDSRSQGGSSKVADGNTPEKRAEDLRKVLGRLRVGRMVLVGWSQGVQDVAAYVNRYGTADIAGIVLVDSTISAGAGTAETTPAAAARTLQSIRAYNDDPRAFTRGMLGAIITRSRSDRETNELVEQMLKTPTAIGSAMLVADMLGTDRSSAINRFDRPTLIVASARSPELPDQKAMSARIRGSQFRVVDNAGHTVFVDQPEVFNQMLTDFLEKQVDRAE